MSNAVLIEISFITDKITLHILSLRGDLKIHAIHHLSLDSLVKGIIEEAVLPQ